MQPDTAGVSAASTHRDPPQTIVVAFNAAQPRSDVFVGRFERISDEHLHGAPIGGVPGLILREGLLTETLRG
jgi:hypothetical protein